MPNNIIVVFMALYLAQGCILEPGVFLEEEFCSLVISVSVAERTSRQKCGNVGGPGVLDVSGASRRAKSQLWP